MEQLHDVAAQYQGFIAQLEDMLAAAQEGEMDEAAIWDTLEAISGEVDDKADALATAYKGMKYRAAAIGEEVKRLQERKKQLEAHAERTLSYIGAVLASCGKCKIETPCNVISVRKAQRVTIDDEQYFVQWAQVQNPDLLRYKEPEADKTAIGRLLKDGKTIEGARLETVEHVNIK
jgi:hypothetical protein